MKNSSPNEPLEINEELNRNDVEIEAMSYHYRFELDSRELRLIKGGATVKTIRRGAFAFTRLVHHAGAFILLIGQSGKDEDEDEDEVAINEEFDLSMAYAVGDLTDGMSFYDMKKKYGPKMFDAIILGLHEDDMIIECKISKS